LIALRNFAAKATGWLSPGNHNHLRYENPLRADVLELEAEAKTFFSCLCQIYEDEQNKTTPCNQRRNNAGLESSGR